MHIAGKINALELIYKLDNANQAFVGSSPTRCAIENFNFNFFNYTRRWSGRVSR